MEVDLLVVDYKTPELLRRLVETLESDYEPHVWNLYVSDNYYANHKEPTWIETAENIHLKRLYLNENVGYAAAINQMAADSEAEILCAVNADAWFTTNHVKQVIETFKNNPKQSILGVKQLDEKNRIRHGGITWDGESNPVHRGWGQYDPLDVGYKDRIQCWTVSGSIYYVRRSVWHELTNCAVYRETSPFTKGAFLDTFMYFEETFCSVHAQRHGYQVWYDGTIETAGHTWNASTGESHTKTTHDYMSESRETYRKACENHGIKHELR